MPNLPVSKMAERSPMLKSFSRGWKDPNALRDDTSWILLPPVLRGLDSGMPYRDSLAPHSQSSNAAPTNKVERNVPFPISNPQARTSRGKRRTGNLKKAATALIQVNVKLAPIMDKETSLRNQLAAEEDIYQKRRQEFQDAKRVFLESDFESAGAAPPDLWELSDKLDSAHEALDLTHRQLQDVEKQLTTLMEGFTRRLRLLLSAAEDLLAGDREPAPGQTSAQRHEPIAATLPVPMSRESVATNIPALVEHYFDKVGDLKIMSARQQQLEEEHGDLRTSCELSIDQELPQSITDQQFQESLDVEMREVQDDYVKSLHEAQAAEIACKESGIDPEWYRRQIVLEHEKDYADSLS
jgi:hypothetical protein